MPGTIDDLKGWLEGFLRALLADIAPQVSAMVEADLTKPTSLLAKESHEYKIQANSQYAVDALLSTTYGLSVLNTRLDNLSNQLTAAYEGMTTAIGIPAQVPTPPLWYTAPPDPLLPADVASAVWAYDLPVRDLNENYYLLTANQWATNIWDALSLQLGFDGIPVTGNPFWRMVGCDAASARQYHRDYLYQPHDPNVPLVDVTSVEDGDTALGWLEREYPSFTYLTSLPISNAGDGAIWIHPEGGQPSYAYRFLLTDAAVMALWPANRSAGGTPPAAALVAPVWPGIAGASLGTAVAISDGLVVEGPLDGVLVNITGHPAGAGKYGFGDVDSWRYLGAVLFINDNGQAEWPIQMGPEVGVLTPRSMKRAASAILRLNGGFTGTITPWTIVG